MSKLFSVATAVIFMAILSFSYSLKSQSVQWAKQYGGVDVDGGTCVHIDAAGNIFTIGYFADTVVFGSYTLTGSGTSDIYVTKTDVNGNVIWAKKYGGTQSENPGSITSDDAGSLYITGSFAGAPSVFDTYTLTSIGSVEIFVAKLDDTNGNVIWAKSYGGAGYDQGFDVESDKVSNIFISGSFSVTATFGTFSCTAVGDWDVFVAKLDAFTGNVIWVSPIGGPNPEIGLSITRDLAGDIYASSGFGGTLTIGTNTLYSNGGSLDIYITRLNSLTGAPVWIKQIGGPGFDDGLRLITDASGNLYASGLFASTVAFDSYTLTVPGLAEGYLAKMDASTGNVLWAKNSGIGGNLSMDNANNLYLSGRFNNPVTIGSSTYTVSPGNTDIALVRADAATGNIVWSKQLGGNALDATGRHATDGAGNTYMTGNFRGSTTYDAFTFTSTPGASTPSDIFLLKIDGPSVPVGLAENNDGFDFLQVMPNPFKDELIILLNKQELKTYSLTIHDILGKTVLHITDSRAKQTLNTSELNKGVYFITIVENGNSRIVKKIIKD